LENDMNNLHPVMRAALAPFAPPPVYSVPRCPAGLFEYVATNILMDCDVVCYLEYEAAQQETRDEPGYAASAMLCAAYVRGVNVYDLMSDGRIEEIEVAALASLERRAAEDAAESAYEAEISRNEYMEV